MKTFTDKSGRIWEIAITLGAAKRLRDKLDIDLLQPEQGDPPLLTRLGTDEILLGEVLCELLSGQFDAHGVGADDIMDAFDGATLLAAQDAFYEDLVDFFRGRGRTDRSRAVETQAEIIRLAIAKAEMKIEQIDMTTLTDGAMSGSSPDR